MTHAIEILYRNRDQVIQAAKAGAKGAWDKLTVSCPEISQAMQLNTFKTHLAGFIVLMELVQADQAKTQELKPMADEAGEMPKSFQGWTVQRSKDGFIRLYKSFKGKVKSLYIGRAWDESKAATKISEQSQLSVQSEPE
jgi:hypothetical protein